MYILQLPDEVLEKDPGIDLHEGASVKVIDIYASIGLSRDT